MRKKKTLNKILKSQKKQIKKLDEIHNTITKSNIDHPSLTTEAEGLEEGSEELNGYITNLLDEYIEGHHRDALQLKLINTSPNHIINSYDTRPHFILKSIGHRYPISSTTKYFEMNIYPDACSISVSNDESNYNNTIKSNFYEIYIDDITEIYNKHAEDMINEMFNTLIIKSNLNTGNSLMEIENILDDE